jgi:hypothetical protein
MIDFPFEVTQLARELGMVSIGKVYLPRRGEAGKAFTSPENLKALLSDCRELLTFEKPAP